MGLEPSRFAPLLKIPGKLGVKSLILPSYQVTMSKVHEVDTAEKKKRRSRVRESVRELERRTETTGQRSPSPTVHRNDSRVEVPVALAQGPPKHSVAGKDSNLRKKDKGVTKADLQANEIEDNIETGDQHR